ncbi:MAG: membrane protein insertase YidC [Alkalispirochaeta sp.]|jgi:YidC/Oxa1 family membrane protein insertase
MEKNTLLAVVLSVVVISVGFMVQNMLYPPTPPEIARTESTDRSDNGTQQTQPTAGAPVATAPGVSRQQIGNPVRPVAADGIDPNPVSYDNGTMQVQFDPAGARITSLKLLDYLDGDVPVEMVLRGDTDRAAFELRFGGPDAPPETALFRRVDSMDPNLVSFRRDFYVEGAPDQPFTVTRTYRFYPGEYIIEVGVEIQNSVNAFVPLDFSGDAYTITYGPQIGPSYTDLDGRNEYRNFYYYDGNKRRNIRMRGQEVETLTERVQWAALSGKYFAVIGIPGAIDYTWTFSSIIPQGLRDGHTLSMTRPVIRSAANMDTFRFYVGPKVKRVLDRYNRAEDNALGLRNLDLDQVQDSRFLFGWLENILKFLMQQITRFVPNYGVAIIILTVLVKLLLFPLTHKSYESTSKMQMLNPKIQEIQKKYKENPQKMNQAMADMYKKEGVSPLGGCLPMLLQFPFFIAMFGLFNNHFDLRGATFINGWITDLSAPESILNFGNFTVPFLGWNDLRLLPILFVGSQLLSSKLMQNPAAGQSSGQMKFMQYGMPIMFFFILYNMPSGLLVYWIFSNILTVGQQYFITLRRKRQATE